MAGAYEVASLRGVATGVAAPSGEAALVPALLLAVTEHEYWVPLLKPVTVSGLLRPLVAKLPVEAAQVAV